MRPVRRIRKWLCAKRARNWTPIARVVAATLFGVIAVLAGVPDRRAHAQSNDLFEVEVTVPVFSTGPLPNAPISSSTFTDRSTFDTFDEAIEAVGDMGFLLINSFYDDFGEAVGELRLLGVRMFTRYDVEEPYLIFSVPELGIEEVFNGATRDESAELFRQYLRRNGGGIFTEVLEHSVAETGVDPVGGNPDSLQGRMAALGYEMGMDPIGIDAGAVDAFDAPVLLGLEPKLGHFSVDGTGGNISQIPFNMNIPLDDPRWQVLVSAPLTIIEIDDAKTYSGQVGVGLRVPMSDDWYLTPVAQIGYIDTDDFYLDVKSYMYALSLTSQYRFYIGDSRITIGNGIGYLKSVPVNSGDYDVEYDLENLVFKNGVRVEMPLEGTFFGQPAGIEASIAETHFEGDELYVNDYLDLYLGIGTYRRDRGMTYDELRMGVSLILGERGYHGIRVGVGYKF